MEFDYELILLICEVPSFQIRAEIVYPSQPATLSTPEQPYKIVENLVHDFMQGKEKPGVEGSDRLTSSFREGSPASLTMGLDVGDEAFILLLGPSSFVGVGFLTTR